MYGDGPERIDLRVVERVARCPAADGIGTKLPTAALERWKVVRDACASWHNGTEPDDVIAQQFGALDAVQREIVTDLFRTYVRLMTPSRDEVVDLEGTSIVVAHPDRDAVVSSYVPFTLEGDDGPELVKLRTGARGSSAWEQAVLLSGKDPEDSVVEVMLAHGTVEHLSADDDEREAALAEIFSTWERQQEEPAGGTRPGWWCFTCPRPARCGQYPSIDGSRIYASTRTIRMSKTWATTLRECHRKVAWKQLHGIPEDDGEDAEDERRSRGVRFHDLIGSALAADDPQAAFDIGLRSVPESEVKNMEWLWDRHLELEADHEHPIDVKETEYQVGLTVVALGKTSDRWGKVLVDQPVAVVFLGRADATGREADGTPAVIEFRTGAGAGEVNQLEVDIYALGVSALTGRDRVVVHLHQIGLPDGPVCVREVYDGDALDQALERLEDPATTVANWHPDDATRPDFTVGPWCGQCVFRRRCEAHR